MIQPSLNDAEIDAQIEGIKALIESGGNTLVRTDVWGRRKLAYPVRRYQEGIYVFFVFEGKPEFIPELTRHYQITEPILRHLTVRCEVDPEAMVISLGDSRERPDRRRRPGGPGDGRDGPRRDGPPRRRDDDRPPRRSAPADAPADADAEADTPKPAADAAPEAPETAAEPATDADDD
ncbi:30S ribosomal protein S6 [Candidatus Poribacteria bacterium]|nr:30S ribosomal protein S6 [Candidatus Poribacteria bacterium]